MYISIWTELASPYAYFGTKAAILFLPPSPSPAHKKYILQRNRILDSPASPTPFFFPL